ncbi:MAG: hypothetical protein COC01_05220 [Bacteroidetes bacterium]|nr:MAG: hypothetical protein COC01_05220 [Bacteroidota bacterium]
MLDKSRILITGACGSIGSGLVERFLEEGHVVCAFDQHEDGLFQLDQKFRADYGYNLKLFIGNVRDEKRLQRAFENVNIVFHCAALKHVYLSEYNPFESTQSNIVGVNNIIEAACATGVDKVIFTSSDKAVNPSSTMGATKLLGERLITAANHHSGYNKTKFASVRFGNVLNTNGSVLHIFKSQLKNNQPFTITSTDMTRFFLTAAQSIDLCIHAAENMIGGEIFIKKMGSCSIMQLAEVLSGKRDFEYDVIGMKPGEKAYEELVTETESVRTVLVNDYYTIIPDILSMLHSDVIQEYEKVYATLPRLNEALSSETDLLSIEEIHSVLQTNNFL